MADGRIHLVLYADAETIDTDPERTECTADVFAALGGVERPDPEAMVPMLDEHSAPSGSPAERRRPRPEW